MKLSKKQEEILNKMQPGKWYCAYDLRCSTATMEALTRKGFTYASYGLGSMFSPRTSCLYKKRERK